MSNNKLTPLYENLFEVQFKSDYYNGRPVQELTELVISCNFQSDKDNITVSFEMYKEYLQVYYPIIARINHIRLLNHDLEGNAIFGIDADVKMKGPVMKFKYNNNGILQLSMAYTAKNIQTHIIEQEEKE